MASKLSALASLIISACGPTFANAVELGEFKAAQAREAGGSQIFNQEFKALHKDFARTKDPLIIDRREFLGAQHLIINRSEDIQPGVTLHSTDGVDLPAAMFSTFGRQLARTFRSRLGIEAQAAEAMAGLLEKQAVEMEGVNYAQYTEATGRALTLDPDAMANVLRQALDFLYETSKIGTRCDVPFIAGYALRDERLIYIDRSVPQFRIFRDVEVPVHKLLNAHERVEKAVLDEFGATYPHAHQIALRLEKVFAEAIGAPWKEYDAYWGPVAERVYDRHFTRVPRDLEMTPYLSFTDAASVATVKEMRAAYIEPAKCFDDSTSH